jgi:hypothetical protein
MLTEALGPLDVIKGADVFVRFKMKYTDGTDAPSEVFSGWVTRVTEADMVWVKFGEQGYTLVFNLHDMVDNAPNYYREKRESECADTLLQVSQEPPMIFCIDM